MTASPATEIDFEIHPSQTRVPAAERERILAAPGFGQVFTDHMITLRWSAERGWHDGKLEPYGPFSLDPATSVFHYGQELFEGLKAYRQDSGSVVMFRPQANAARFNAGCRRMAMPELPEETFLRALELLVAQDRDWIPDGEGNSLYLRPFMIATQRGLGVNHPSTSYLFCVIASPAGAYFGASQGGQGLAVGGLHPGRPRRHRRGQVRRQLRGRLRRPAAGGGQGLRPGGLARRGRAPVGRGDGRHEPVLRVRVRRRRPDPDARADRLAAARDHPGLAAAAGPDARHRGGGGPDLGLRTGARTAPRAS